MSSPSSPQVPTPAQSAQAESMAQVAGQEFNLATTPIQAYAEALDQLQYDPTFQQIANAEQANSALGTAQANKEVNAQVNPYGSAGQDSFNKSASERLANVSGGGYYPGLTPTNDTNAFAYPSTGSLPDFNQAISQAKALTSAMPQMHVTDKSVYPTWPGTTPQIPTSTFNTGNTGIPGGVGGQV